jgi:hypothetical protein
MKYKIISDLVYDAINKTNKKITYKTATPLEDFTNTKTLLIKNNIAFREINDKEKQIIFITNSRLQFKGVEK